MKCHAERRAADRKDGGLRYPLYKQRAAEGAATRDRWKTVSTERA